MAGHVIQRAEALIRVEVGSKARSLMARSLSTTSDSSGVDPPRQPSPRQHQPQSPDSSGSGANSDPTNNTTRYPCLAMDRRLDTTAGSLTLLCGSSASLLLWTVFASLLGARTWLHTWKRPSGERRGEPRPRTADRNGDISWYHSAPWNPSCHRAGVQTRSQRYYAHRSIHRSVRFASQTDRSTAPVMVDGRP